MSDYVDCGIMPHGEASSKRSTELRRVRYCISPRSVSNETRATAVLLACLSRENQEARIAALLRHVRHVILSTVRGAGYWYNDSSVLFQAVLHGLARSESVARYISENRPHTRASRSRRSRARTTAISWRGRSPYRLKQTEQPPIESCHFPIAGASRALPFRGNEQ